MNKSVDDSIREMLVLEFQLLCAEFDKTRVWAEAESGCWWFEHTDIIDVKNRIKAKVKEICGENKATDD